MTSQKNNSYNAFNSLYNKAKQLDNSVDFTELRMLYTKTDEYNPFDVDYENEIKMFKYLNEKKINEAFKCAEKILDKNCLHIDAHLILSNNSEFHSYMFDGLIKSLIKSGKGYNKENAFIVIDTREEYSILQLLGLQFKKQTMIELDGRQYDIIDVENSKDGSLYEIYFNIDIPQKWLGKNK